VNIIASHCLLHSGHANDEHDTCLEKDKSCHLAEEFCKDVEIHELFRTYFVIKFWFLCFTFSHNVTFVKFLICDELPSF